MKELPTERSGVAAVVNVLPITLRDKRGQRHVGRHYSINVSSWRDISGGWSQLVPNGAGAEKCLISLRAPANSVNIMWLGNM